MVDPYQVLGVERGSRADVITKAYRRLARQYHPDRFAASQSALQDIAQQKMSEINIAYEVLTDPAAAARHRDAQTRRDAALRRNRLAELPGDWVIFPPERTTDDGDRPPARHAAQDFDYRRGASAEFDVDPLTADEAAATSQPWTMPKKPKGGIFRRK